MSASKSSPSLDSSSLAGRLWSFVTARLTSPGIVIFFGGGPNHTRLVFYYWKDPGAFIPYKSPGDTGKFLAFWTALVRSGFAFILSPELIAITAGESRSPRRNIPKAAGRFLWRLAFFYCLGSLVISILVKANDPRLVQAVDNKKSDAGASPFVLGIENAGIPVLNHIISRCLLTFPWQCSWADASGRRGHPNQCGFCR